MSGLFLRGRNWLENYRRPPVCEEPALVLPRPETADDLQVGATGRSAGLVGRVRPLSGHSYFVDESSWVVSGTYLNEKSVPVTVEGKSVVTRRGDLCFNEVAMKLSPPEGEDYRSLEYRTVYEYAPIETGTDSTVWQASNDPLGRLHGVLAFVDEMILSSYQTTSGSIRGVETFLRISANEYRCRGVLFESGKKSSSWALRYRKA
jgi:hypothetical protein